MSDSAMSDRSARATEHSPDGKRAYTPPVVREYGRLRDLTQGEGGWTADSGFPGSHPTF